MFQNPSVPFFETVIRYLGGLLSAYALSGESILLAKANELANLLDPVFSTGSGLPAYAVNFKTLALLAHVPILSLLIGSTTASIHSGQNVRNEFGILAEIGSFQLEYAYLSKLTGNKTQFHRVGSSLHRQCSYLRLLTAQANDRQITRCKNWHRQILT